MFVSIFTFADMGWNVKEVQADTYSLKQINKDDILNTDDYIKNDLNISGSFDLAVYDNKKGTKVGDFRGDATTKINSFSYSTFGSYPHVKVYNINPIRSGKIALGGLDHSWGAATCTEPAKCTITTKNGTKCTATKADSAKGHTFNQYSASGDTITVKCERFSASDCGESLTYTLKVNDCTGEIPYVNRNSYADAEITKSGTGTPSVGEPSIKYRKVVDGTKQDLASKPSDTGSYEAYITMNGQTVSCSFSIAPGGDTYHFDANGGSGSMADQLMLQTDWDAGNKKLNKNTYTRTGYSFDKWTCESSSKEFSDEAEVDRPTLTPPVTYTLNAQWKANDYTVTFDNCGADIEAGSASATVTYDKTLDNITIPEKRCAEFNGYYTAVNGGGDKIYNADGSPAIPSWTTTSDTTLYAYWTVNHNWGFEVADNQIIAKCKNSGCGYEQKLTLSASDATYNKSAYTGASVSNEDEFPDKKANSDIQYEGTTAAGASYAKSSTAPTDAGTYKAMVTVYGKTAIKDFNIDRAAQSASASVGDYQWGSTLPSPSVSGEEESATPTYYYNTANSTTGGIQWSELNSETLNVGDYYIYAILAETDNYKGGPTSVGTFHVSGLTFDSTSITASPYEGTYDGNAYTIAFSIDRTKEPSAKVTFSTESDTGYSETMPTFKNAGNYEVFYRVEKFGYEVYQQSKTVTIAKAPITISGIEAKDKVYDGNATAEFDYANVQYDGIISGDNLTVTATGTFDNKNVGEGKAVSISNLELGGTSKDNYVLAASGQQNSATADITQKEVTLTWSADSFDYNESEQRPTATAGGLADGDTCTVTVELVDATESKDVGSYIAKATSLSNENYKLPSGVTKRFIIKKIDQTGITLSMTSSYEYSADPVPSPNVTGAKESPTITYYYSLEDTTSGGTVWKDMTPEALEPDTYYMYAVLNETTNYKSYTTSTVSFTVNGADMSGDVSASDNTQTYTGTAVHGITVNTLPDSTIKYGTSEGEYTLSESPKYKDVGTYTVYYKVTKTGYNPVTGSAKVIINKATLNVTPDDNQTKVYGDADPAFTYTVSGLLGSDTASVVSGTLMRDSGENVTSTGYELSNNNLTATNYNITCTPGVKFMITPRELTADMITLTTKKFERTGSDIDVSAAGNIVAKYNGEDITYSIISGQTATELGTYNVTIEGTGNFKGTVSKEWKITNTIVPDISAINYEGIYDGNSHTITVSGTQAGDTVTYGTSEDAINSESVSFINAGTHTVWYKVARGDYEPFEASATVTINPKEISVTWGNTSLVYNGQTQAPQATASGMIGSDACNVTVTGAGAKDVGSSYTATAIGVSNVNYKIPATAPTTTFSIAPKAITVTGKSTSKYVNGSDPSLTYVAPGLCAGDTLSGVTVTRDAGEAVGSYAIKVTVDAAANPNYIITTQDGTFTIKKREQSNSGSDTNTENPPSSPSSPSNNTTPVVETPVTTPKIEDLLLQPVTPVESKTKVSRSDETGEVQSADINEDDIDSNAGNLTLHVEVLEESPIKKADVSNNVGELLNNSDIFTQEEVVAIKNGENAKIWVSVDKLDMSNISSEEQEKLTEVAKEIEGEDVKLLYFDINLFKQIGSSEVFAIREPGTFIKVSIELPEYAINTDEHMEREYKVLRLHDGEVTVLDTEYDPETRMLTFETDKFSTYVFAYVDKEIVDESLVNDTVINDVAETANEVEAEQNETSGHNYIWLIILLVVLIAIVAYIIYRKKKEDQYIIK